MRGRDIKRYGYDWAGLYLINSHNGYTTESGKIVPAVNIEDYPAIKRWLDSEAWNNQYPKITAKERLSKRTDKGRTPYNLRDCAYMDDFDKQKIIYQELSQGSRFAIDDSGEFAVTNTAYVLVGSNLKYLIRILNNRLTEFIFRHYYSVTMGSSGIRWLNQYIVELPIIAPDQWIEDKTNILTEKEVFQFLIKSYHFSDLEISWILTNVKH